jgi:hypothetical protein
MKFKNYKMILLAIIFLIKIHTASAYTYVIKYTTASVAAGAGSSWTESRWYNTLTLTLSTDKDLYGKGETLRQISNITDSTECNEQYVIEDNVVVRDDTNCTPVPPHYVSRAPSLLKISFGNPNIETQNDISLSGNSIQDVEPYFEDTMIIPSNTPADDYYSSRMVDLYAYGSNSISTTVRIYSKPITILDCDTNKQIIKTYTEYYNNTGATIKNNSYIDPSGTQHTNEDIAPNQNICAEYGTVSGPEWGYLNVYPGICAETKIITINNCINTNTPPSIFVK